MKNLVVLLLLLSNLFFGISFQNLFKKHTRKPTFILKKTITYFPEENEDNFMKKINMEFDYHNYDNNNDKSLYILLWFDCKECTLVRNHMEILNLKYIFINIDILYTLKEIENSQLFPLLYKEDICVGDNLFDIYKEIYLNV
jgi:hypothetical protein